jgi:hypothetical protein
VVATHPDTLASRQIADLAAKIITYDREMLFLEDLKGDMEELP